MEGGQNETVTGYCARMIVLSEARFVSLEAHWLDEGLNGRWGPASHKEKSPSEGWRMPGSLRKGLELKQVYG